MDINPIKTEEDYEEALELLAGLWDAKEGTEDFDKMDIMATLIDAYEKKNFPINEPDPIQAILFRMDQQSLTHNDMTVYLGDRSKVSEVLNYKRGLSIGMMRKINEGLGIPMNILAKAYDLDKPTRPQAKARREAGKRAYGG
ncbi:MAG: transcriptional regulator [Pseudomonadales bacterium]|nr:transcriptional regulator [Pseudomonadales bacterium]